MLRFLPINSTNLHLLRQFLDQLGSGVESFRYYQKRPIETALQHVLTAVAMDEQQQPVAYGHLDREGENLWLGIAVAESSQGRGVGKQMITHLIRAAQTAGEREIVLTVDKTNTKAIRLYETNGFIRTAQQDHYYIYRMHLS